MLISGSFSLVLRALLYNSTVCGLQTHRIPGIVVYVLQALGESAASAKHMLTSARDFYIIRLIKCLSLYYVNPCDTLRLTEE